MRIVAVLFFMILNFISGAKAAEMVQFGENARSFGMGGIRVMNPHDPGAFLWNPASLAYAEGFNWDVVNLNLGVNGVDAYNNFKDVKIEGLDDLGPLYGKHLWVGAQGYSAFTLPYFGVAVYDQAMVDLILHNPAFPELNVNYLNDYAFAIGGAVPLGPGASFGITAKRITRLGGPKVIGAETLDAGSIDGQAIIDQFQNQGIGYGLDTGLMYRVPAPLNPTLSLAWQDVGKTSFIQTKGLAAPPRIEDNLTFSATFEQDLTVIGIAGGFEYRHITDANEQLGKKLFTGLELSLLNIDIRGGFAQGYASYGAGIDLWFFQLDAAMYTVERGAYTGQTPENRIQVGLSMNFGFDPDFKLTDSNGKRRHLKQRR